MNIFEEYFGNEWDDIRYIEINDVLMFLAHDVCKMLCIRNTTCAVRSVSEEYKTMDKIPAWNSHRNVHLLTLEGVLELILNSRAEASKRFKHYFASEVLCTQRRISISKRAA